MKSSNNTSAGKWVDDGIPFVDMVDCEKCIGKGFTRKKQKNKCLTCNGAGCLINGGKIEVCEKCKGGGFNSKTINVKCDFCDEYGYLAFLVKNQKRVVSCDKCDGKGKRIGVLKEAKPKRFSCEKCKGSGSSELFRASPQQWNLKLKKQNYTLSGHSFVCPSCNMDFASQCEICDGSRKLLEYYKKCDKCNGLGNIYKYTKKTIPCSQCDSSGVKTERKQIRDQKNPSSLVKVDKNK